MFVHPLTDVLQVEYRLTASRLSCDSVECSCTPVTVVLLIEYRLTASWCLHSRAALVGLILFIVAGVWVLVRRV